MNGQKTLARPARRAPAASVIPIYHGKKKALYYAPKVAIERSERYAP